MQKAPSEKFIAILILFIFDTGRSCIASFCLLEFRHCFGYFRVRHHSSEPGFALFDTGFHVEADEFVNEIVTYHKAAFVFLALPVIGLGLSFGAAELGDWVVFTSDVVITGTAHFIVTDLDLENDRRIRIPDPLDIDLDVCANEQLVDQQGAADEFDVVKSARISVVPAMLSPVSGFWVRLGCRWAVPGTQFHITNQDYKKRLKSCQI
ncbi:MAG: hypothetical protein P8X86_09330 [Desulfofustis sp.]